MQVDFLREKTLLITRGKEQSKELSEQVVSFGGVPITVPLLAICEPSEQSQKEIETVFAHLASYDWLVFTSKNGVDYFFRFLKKFNLQLASKHKIAVIGTKTAEQLACYGFRASFVAPKFVAEAFLPSFLEILEKEETVLICKGNLARDYIAKGLAQASIAVQEVIVYDNVVPKDAEVNLQTVLEQNQIDVIFFASPSAVTAFMQIVEKKQLFAQVKDSIIVVIGPVTEKKAQEFGLSVAICAEEYTVSGMLSALKEVLR